MLCGLIVATGFEKMPKVKKSPNLVTLVLSQVATFHSVIDFQDFGMSQLGKRLLPVQWEMSEWELSLGELSLGKIT